MNHNKKVTLKTDVGLTADFINENDMMTISIEGHTRTFSIADLASLLVATSKKKYFDDFMSDLEAKGNMYKRQHRVRVNKDLKKGDEMVVNCDIFVPQIVKDGQGNISPVDFSKG